MSLQWSRVTISTFFLINLQCFHYILVIRNMLRCIGHKLSPSYRDKMEYRSSLNLVPIGVERLSSRIDALYFAFSGSACFHGAWSCLQILACFVQVLSRLTFVMACSCLYRSYRAWLDGFITVIGPAAEYGLGPVWNQNHPMPKRRKNEQWQRWQQWQQRQ